MIDWTSTLKRLDPNQDGEQPVRHRSAVVDAVNSDGTVDLDFDGTVIPGVSVLAGAFITPGVTVQVAVWRGDMLVLGATRSANAGGPLGVLGYDERTTDRTNIGGTEVDLVVTTTVAVAAGRRLGIQAAFRMQASTAEDRVVVRLYEDATVIKSWVKRFRASGAADTEAGVILSAPTPTAGNHTYKLAAQRITGTGVFALIASPSDPALLLVEDVGPA